MNIYVPLEQNLSSISLHLGLIRITGMCSKTYRAPLLILPPSHPEAVTLLPTGLHVRWATWCSREACPGNAQPRGRTAAGAGRSEPRELRSVETGLPDPTPGDTRSHRAHGPGCVFTRLSSREPVRPTRGGSTAPTHPSQRRCPDSSSPTRGDSESGRVGPKHF